MPQARSVGMIVGLLSAFLLTGCGGEQPIPRAAVKGTVTWDKEPLKEGTIAFVPVEGTKGLPVGAPIVNGSYALDEKSGPSIGKNRVEITANKKTGKTIPAAFPATGDIEKVEQYLPAKYNTKSTTVADVAKGENTFNYDLMK